MPAPRCCSSAGERSWMVTSIPRSRRSNPAVSPPSEPPTTATRAWFTDCVGCSGLAEGGDAIDPADEQHAALVDRRIAQSVGWLAARVLGPDLVELRSDGGAFGGIVFEDFALDGRF